MTYDLPFTRWLIATAQRYALRAIRQVVTDERFVRTGTRASIHISKSLLAAETRRMVDSRDGKTVATGMFLEFLFGVGPRTRTFDGGSVVADYMRNAPGVERAREFFYETRAKDYERNKTVPGTLARSPLTEYGAGFGLTGLIQAGVDPIEQFVGNYVVEIFPDEQGKRMHVVCTNKTGRHSFLYHLPFVYDQERVPGFLPTPMGNIYQTIQWYELIDDSRFEAHLARTR